MISLIAYADRLGGDLRGLHALLDEDFSGLFGGVHILPFFDPIDGADAGFDPVDHLSVDGRLGDWDGVRAISQSYSVMADMIVNHVSADSPQFLDVMEHGPESDYWNLFLRKDTVFPPGESAGALAEDLKRIYRPRPGSPFTPLTLADGSVHDFWTTFSPKQLDIDVESPTGKAYLGRILDAFEKAGVREVRLDAAGYAIKRRGTACFMLPETMEFIAELAERAKKRGIASLVEIHSHYQTQRDIAERCDRVYDFALPPLVLHTLYTKNSAPLKRWIAMAPRNCVTVLDTHDGIGIVDIARHGDRPGLISDDEVSSLVDTIHERTGGSSRKASGHSASNLDVYQVNSTFYDALGRRDDEYLIARAIQLFVPGDTQIYYVGLLAGENDMELLQKTGVGRDINRHYFTHDEIREAMQRPVVRKLCELIRLRNRCAAFDGDFSLDDCSDQELVLSWRRGDDFAELRIDLAAMQASVNFRQGGEETRVALGHAQ